MTITLLLNSEGKKMGKTASGAVWLDPEKTSPYEFYQYWRNVGDGDVLKCIRMLTFLPLEKIDEMDSWEGSQLNEAKEILAYELTALVHGEEEAVRAQNAARAIFGAGADSADMPSTQLTEEQFADGAIELANLLIACGIATSKGNARQLITKDQCISIDGEKVTDGFKSYTADDFTDGQLVIRKGKKIFHKALAPQK